MLTRLIFSFLLMFFVTVGISQPTTYEPTFQSAGKEIENRFTLNKSTDLEFRFGTKNPLTRKIQLFILSQVQNKWQARFFEKTVRGTDTLVEIPLSQNNLYLLWESLRNKTCQV